MNSKLLKELVDLLDADISLSNQDMQREHYIIKFKNGYIVSYVFFTNPLWYGIFSHEIAFMDELGSLKYDTKYTNDVLRDTKETIFEILKKIEKNEDL